MTAPQRIVMVGPFGLEPRMTMRVRALPLGKALAARGHTVTMLLPPWQNPDDAGHSWCEEGVRIENMMLPRGIPGWFQWRLTRSLVQRIQELTPNVVHAFKPKAYAGLVHWRLFRRYPVVVDADDWEGPGGWNDQGDYPRWLQRVFAWQERWGLTRAAAVTVASRALQTLVWSMGGPSERVYYLPNGVRPQQVLPSDSGGRPTVLLYTRFFEFELDRLWRIMQLVRARRPEVRFLIVGKGFANEEERLLRMAQSHGWYVIASTSDIPDADLVYVGWGTEATLPRYFGAADVAIYPFDDTLLNRTKCPVKLLDLLSAGIPVVGDAVGQIGEVIMEGKTGRLVAPGDDLAFAEAVLELLVEPQRLKSMGAAAKKDVHRRYSWDRLAEVAETAYRYAIAHGTG